MLVQNLGGGPSISERVRVKRSRAAANPVPLPKLKPRAMRELLVVPAIRSREIAWAHRSAVRNREDALQSFNVRNRLFGVHPSQ